MKTKPLILIVDDEADFIETMKFFLQNAGFRIITASNGKEGLEQAKLLPDLILTDLKMPFVSGHEVCRLLKEDAKTRNIPVIMLTSQNDTIDKVEALNIGAVDYIGKHFSFEEILARIKAAIRRKDGYDADSTHEKNTKIMELRQIINKEEIRILFQSIVSLADKKPIGYEALARGPKGGALENPSSLFELAYQLDMFFELDVLCRNLSVKKATGLLREKERLFLNMDPMTLDTPHFKNLEFLSGSHIKAEQVCLEISERTIITNFEKISLPLESFKEKGIMIAIDDVGSGYSNLRSISELKPDYIKIDIALVRSIDSKKVNQNLIQSLNTLSDNIGCILIAEGIETENEYNTLIDLGVRYGQGFFISRPSEIPS